MHTVLVGLPLGGHLSLWHGDGRVSYWRVIDSTPLRDRLGHGTVARSEVVPRRFREAGMLNAENATLFLPDRYRGDGDQVGATAVRLAPVTREAARTAAGQENPAEVFGWLGGIVLAAARRGEFVAVETGGWEIPFAPYVLMLAGREPDGAWYSHVETSPVPRGAYVWRDQPAAPDATSQVVGGPANMDTIMVAGRLAGFAIGTWRIHPFELGLSFGPSPSGPWPG